MNEDYALPITMVKWLAANDEDSPLVSEDSAIAKAMVKYIDASLAVKHKEPMDVFVVGDHAEAEPKVAKWFYSLCQGGAEVCSGCGISTNDLYWFLSTIQASHEGTLLLAGATDSFWLAPYRLRVLVEMSDGTRKIFQFRTGDALAMERYAMELADKLSDASI